MFHDNIKTRFGFGCMRLKLDDNKNVDYENFSKMIDIFMENGFTYFDTARVYIDGKSETALRDCLVKRYKRDSFTLTDKLSKTCWNKEEDIRPFFMSQLESLGTDYLDYYLMHALNAEFYERYVKEHAFEVVKKLKEEGYIRHIGISFHDSPEVLDRILSEQKDIEVVQIQFNYLDLSNPKVQSQACYDVCVKHSKPVIVMEPIKGGTLINLPPEAMKIYKGKTPAEMALRFVADHEQVFMILSGMGTVEMMEENVSFMKDIKPLTAEEKEEIKQVSDILRSLGTIPCTACHYCTPGCPIGMEIPEIFALYNHDIVYKDWNAKDIYGKFNPLADQCLSCGQCEGICPQSLKIISLLKNVSEHFK